MAEEVLRRIVEGILEDMGVSEPRATLQAPSTREPEHGDLTTNVALALASALRRPPREIAEEIAERLRAHPGVGAAGVTEITVGGPGFLNFHLTAGRVAGELTEIVAGDESWGRSAEGRGRPVMVEFVSANPTGPLHLGHGRQACLGDAIASLLEWTGWDVHREFYYNDAGRQMELLARSVWARYHEHFGEDASVPEGGYRGEYVREIAVRLAQEVGEVHLHADDPETLDGMRRFAVRLLRKEQDRDLDRLGVHFDQHFLESALYDEGRVDATLDALRETGLVYEREGAVWLRTTEFGDQKDRVMVRSDGTPTYFLPDVAYHLTKWERGFRHAVNVQGADHHGTVARVRAGLRALGLPEGYPEYVLHQMVTVMQGGEEVKLSKRAGTYTTVGELVEAVGADVVRYFFQMRKPEAHLVFDLDVALDHSEKNPVYKAQYAHARMCSIFRKAGVPGREASVADAALERLSEDSEQDLIKRLSEFPEVVERAAEKRAPHLVCDYLEQTAGAVNSWYHAGNPSRNPELAVLVDDPELRQARLVLARAVQVVLRNALRLLGITAPERMVREREDGAGEASFADGLGGG